MKDLTEIKTDNRMIRLSELIKPILIDLQLMMREFKIDELKAVINSLEELTSIQRALPFPETQNKADLNKKKNKLMSAIVNLAERQQDVLEHKN